MASFAWPAFLEEWARDLLQDEEIVCELPQEWAEGFVDGERMGGSGARHIRSQKEFFANALAISDEKDDGIYLLNSLITGADGEWQACLFANWLPGVAT